MKDQVYTPNFDYLSSAVSRFELRTPWAIKEAQGATFETIAPAVYRFTVNAHAPEMDSHPYQHGKVILIFANDKIRIVKRLPRVPEFGRVPADVLKIESDTAAVEARRAIAFRFRAIAPKWLRLLDREVGLAVI
ncbi:MAG: hypothetical protein WB683_06740 [Candidatus Sulfotelmatobacter sp.]